MKRKKILLGIMLFFICGWSASFYADAENLYDTSDVVLKEGLVREDSEDGIYNEEICVQDNRPVVSILGDSLSSYKGYGPWGIYYYYYCDTYMNVNSTWWMRYINGHDLRLGMNDSLGGSRVTWVENDSTGYQKNQCMASEERIASLDDNGTPDVILFFGGTNDIGYSELGTFTPGERIGDVSNFYSAYQTAIVRLKRSYPNAEIICLTPYYRDAMKMDANRTEQDDATVDQYVNAILQICRYYNVRCVDLRQAGIDREQDVNSKDYLHVNEKGMRKIWYFLENGMPQPQLINGMCWLMKDTSIDVGTAYNAEAGNPEFRYQTYNLDTKEWNVIADWGESNWVSWMPKKGNYWLNVQVRSEEGVLEEKTVCFAVNRNYPVYINGKYQGPNPYGTGWLVGVSSNTNPNQGYSYELLVLDCAKYVNGDKNPWIYGTGLNKVKSGCTFWTTYTEGQSGYYWTYFRIYDEKGNLIEDQCYGAIF